MVARDTVIIRDARDDERNAIRDVVLAAYSEYSQLMPGPFWSRYRQHLIETIDADGAIHRIVAELHGAIVGSVLLFPPATAAYGSAVHELDCPEVRLLAVVPAARGKGVGEALMHECARRARRMGARALGLHTTDVMRAAVRMYERLGYVRVPEVDFSPAMGIVVKGYRLGLGVPGY